MNVLRAATIGAATMSIGLGIGWLAFGGSSRPSGSLTVTVAGRAVQVGKTTTLAALAAQFGLRPRSGNLLDVRGRVLRRGVFPGDLELDGRPSSGKTRLHGGDRVSVVEGRDRSEALVDRTVRTPGGVPSDPQFFVDRVPGAQVDVLGSVSHELVSSRFRAGGAAKAQRAVALTFDDGPSPEYTPQILAELRKLHVHATFFVIGYLAAAYPSLVRREAEMGMAVGNHSYNHPDVPPFNELPAALIQDEIALDDQVLGRLGVRTRLFRPPGGGSSAEVVRLAAALGQRVVLWSVDPTDWEPGVTAREIAQRVLSAVGPGSIVEMHDGGGDRSATLAALPAIVHGIRARGLRLVTLGGGTGPIAETSSSG